MKQAFHIFRKDARRFAYQIGALAALTCMWAWSNIAAGRAGSADRYAGIATAVLSMGWWYLICLLVHEESFTGDRQFWITRPYSRRSLLAAKALFVLAFVNAPLLLGGFAILAAAGYRPLAYLPNFLWMQITFTAVALLVPAAIAALTRTLVQFVLAIVGLYTSVILLAVVGGHVQRGYQSQGLAWTGGIFLMLMVTAPALMVFVLQLRMRNRLISAGVGIALMVLMLYTNEGVGRRFGVAVQSRLFGQHGAASVEVMLDATGIRPDAKQLEPDGVTLAVPLRVVNIPAAETVAPEIVNLTFETPAGQRWSSGWIPAASNEPGIFQVDPSPDGAFRWRQRVVVDRAFWRHAASGPLTVRGEVYLMLFGRRSVRLQQDGMTRVPGDGWCSVSLPLPNPGGRQFDCFAPFHRPFSQNETVQEATATGVPHSPVRLLSIWDSPLPADFGMNPISRNSPMPAGREAEILFLRYDPRAYIHRSFLAATWRPERPPQAEGLPH
jgi:hypothetical protein